MKKRILAAALLAALLLTGCRTRQEPQPAPEPDIPEETAIHLETLAVEFAAEGGADLLPALNRLPQKLQTALGEAGVEVDAVQMTLAAAQDTAARAVGEGGVDLSFLSAEAFLRADCGGVPLLADAEDGQPGRAGLLCAGPSDYGRALAGREAPTWEELAHGRWGVLEADSGPGHRFVSLWLADRYEGNTLTDLPQVTVYESYEALLRAAAREEIDVFPCTPGTLEDLADAWCLEVTRSDGRGYQGFGREVPLSEEVTVLGTPERYCSRLAVVREDGTLSGEAFTRALSQALEDLAEDPDWLRLAGAEHFAPLTEDSLDALRRLITIEG